jgi:hypothetical protein
MDFTGLLRCKKGRTGVNPGFLLRFADKVLIWSIECFAMDGSLNAQSLALDP